MMAMFVFLFSFSFLSCINEVTENEILPFEDSEKSEVTIEIPGVFFGGNLTISGKEKDPAMPVKEPFSLFIM